MPAHQILFCPFCRDSFEGVARCPEHELVLVPLDRLPPAGHEHDVDDSPGDGERLSVWDPRFGRGLVALAALLNSAALLLPLGGAGDAALAAHRTLTLCAVFPVLWTLLLVSITLLFVLLRRTTRSGLMSVRLLVPLLAPLSPLALAIVGHRLGRDAPSFFLGGAGGGGGAGYAVLAASACMIAGGIGFRSARKSSVKEAADG